MRDILSFDRADHRLSAYLEFFILNSISSFSQSQRDTWLLSARKFAILFVCLFVCLFVHWYLSGFRDDRSIKAQCWIHNGMSSFNHVNTDDGLRNDLSWSENWSISVEVLCGPCFWIYSARLTLYTLSIRDQVLARFILISFLKIGKCAMLRPVSLIAPWITW